MDVYVGIILFVMLAIGAVGCIRWAYDNGRRDERIERRLEGR